jgi:tetratricopeptide (TPR) repeat protein
MRTGLLLLSFFVFFSAQVFSQTAASLYKEYSRAEKAADWAQAERIARQGVSAYPDELGFITCLTYALRKEKKPAEALAVIKPAYAKYPAEKNIRDNYVYTLTDLGWELDGKKEYAAAHDYFFKAYSVNPDDQWAVNAYGYSLGRIGKWEESIAVLKKGMADFPENAQIPGNLVSSYLSYGWDFYNAKDFSKAVELFREARALKPDDEYCLNAYGVGLRETGALQEAIGVLETGYKKYPANAYLKGNLLWTYLLKANREKESVLKNPSPNKTGLDAVETWFQKAGAVDAGNESYLLNYGIFLNDVKRYDEALAVLEKGERLFPADPFFTGNIQFSFQEKERGLAAKKEYAVAIDVITKARQRFPDEAWFLIDLVNDYFALKDYGRSGDALVEFALKKNLQEYRKPLEYNKEELVYFRVSPLVWKFAEQSDFKSGFSLIDKIAAAYPDAYFISEMRGILFFLSGEKEKGIALVNKAYDQYAAVHPEAKKTITISLPLRGTYLVYGNNRGDSVTHAGVNRFCYDFMGANVHGEIVKPGVVFPGEKNADYYGFGTDILCPVDGVIEDVIDRYDDMKPRAIPVLGDGNMITVTDDAGYHYVFAHLRKGSTKVVKGQHVKTGAKLGEMGNTGYSAYPHFHFGVYTADWRVSLEVQFSSYKLIGKNGEEKLMTMGVPQTGDVIRN